MLLLTLLTAPSQACSCAGLQRASLERCQDGAVVYGGRVAGYQWPSGPSPLSEDVRVALMLALGDGAQPTPWTPPARLDQALIALEKMWPVALQSSLLFFISMLVGFGTGRLIAPRHRPRAWTIAATLSLVLALAGWLLWCALGQSYWSYTEGPRWGVLVAAALQGAVLGRSPVSGRVRAALSLLVLVSLALALLPRGRASMVWDLEEVTCNTQRAQRLLQDQGDLEQTYTAWREEPPKTCGAQHYWPRQSGTKLCLSFEDENGGRTTLCGKNAAQEHRFASTRRLKRPPPFRAPH